MSIFDNCLEVLKTKCLNININNNFLQVVKYAMEIVELTELKGNEQKIMVISIVKKIIQDSDMEMESKSLCLLLIDNGTVENTIDMLVDATKGKLNINIKRKIKKYCCI